MVDTLRFHCGVHGFYPWFGNEDPTYLIGAAKKKEEEEEEEEVNQRQTFLQWMLKESSVFLSIKLIKIFLKGKKKICVTSNKKPEGEIKEIIPFIIVSKRIKCLGKKLPRRQKTTMKKTVRH